MKDERPCDKCIFHDGTCHHWNCEPITRNEAEVAVKTLRDLAARCCDTIFFGEGVRKEEQ